MAQSTWTPADMLDRLGGDEELARQLAVIFIHECPAMMAAVRDSVAAGSGAALRRAAHALKGSVGNFTDSAPTTTAHELERLGSQDNVADAARVLARLEGEVAAFISVLQQFQDGKPCAS